MPARKGGLGRGLGALLSSVEEEGEEVQSDVRSELPITAIVPNADQPRKSFDEGALKELSDSISKFGVITPLIVSPMGDGKYMIIAGERRYRASKMAGLTSLPVYIRECNAKEVDELSLIENIQREDLNPIEIAEAINNLMANYSYTQEQVADRVGKSRPAVANYLRLLTLTEEVRNLVADGRLSAGHARCLVTVSDPKTQLTLAQKGMNNAMSVREFEKFVKHALTEPTDKKPPQPISLELKDLVNRMQRVFATKVSVLGNDRKGRIYMDYYSMDDLNRLEKIISTLEKLDDNKNDD